MSRKRKSSQPAEAPAEQNKGGRPQVVVDVQLVTSLCEIQCTGEEVAAMLHIDYDTLNAALERQVGHGFSEHFKQNAKRGHISLRRVQWQKALSGDNTMLIWLGKQHLGQRDKHELDAKHDVTSRTELSASERVALRTLLTNQHGKAAIDALAASIMAGDDAADDS